LHDLVHLERRGIPAVGIATAPFADEAIEQARRLGMPAARMAYIPHPVQLLTDDELDARADAVFPRRARRADRRRVRPVPGRGTATARTG